MYLVSQSTFIDLEILAIWLQMLWLTCSEKITEYNNQNLYKISHIYYLKYKPISDKTFLWKLKGNIFKATHFSHKALERIGRAETLPSPYSFHAFRESNLKCVIRSTVEYKTVNPQVPA